MNFYRRRTKAQRAVFNFFCFFSVRGLKAFASLSLCCCLLTPSRVFSQSPANLEVFYRLADSSAAKVLKAIPRDETRVYLRLDLPEGYSVFRNRIIQDFRQEGKDVLVLQDSIAPALGLSIDGARVSYSDLFRNGFWGSYRTERTFTFNGSFALALGGMIKNSGKFSFTAKDTVDYDGLRQLEDPSIPFTRGNIPPEPLFSTLWEPVVALGTAAVAVYLFFTVRSK